MRSVIAVAVLIAAVPAAARSEETADQIRRQFSHPCDDEKLSHVEQSTCLADAVKRMTIRLTAEYKKGLASADGDAANAAIGGRSGPEIARKERTDLVRAQKSWENYKDAECFRVADEIDLGGGNGSDVAEAACVLDHMAQRIVELKP